MNFFTQTASVSFSSEKSAINFSSSSGNSRLSSPEQSQYPLQDLTYANIAALNDLSIEHEQHHGHSQPENCQIEPDYFLACALVNGKRLTPEQFRVAQLQLAEFVRRYPDNSLSPKVLSIPAPETSWPSVAAQTYTPAGRSSYQNSISTTVHTAYSPPASMSPYQNSSPMPSTPYSAPEVDSRPVVAMPMGRAESSNNAGSSNNTRSSHNGQLAQRARRALRESIDRGNRPLLLRSTEPNYRVHNRVQSQASSRASRGRKRNERRVCEICTKTLSGDHEYNRHFKLIHAPQGWRWQVIDPSSKGLRPIHHVPFQIADCKHCQNNKLYGINYNAAAHIRRVHFKSEPINGSRGGSSGGTFPDIRYLEYLYMKLVHIRQVSDNKKRPKEGVDYARTGYECSTILREPHSKRHSSSGPPGGYSEADFQDDPGSAFPTPPYDPGEGSSASAALFSPYSPPAFDFNAYTPPPPQPLPFYSSWGDPSAAASQQHA